MRSLVPMLKKSACSASRSAVSAAEGTSIMTPIGTCGTASPPARSAAAARSTAARAARSSSTPETKGNMIRSGPCTAARSSARSCVWKTSSFARLSRTPRSPSGARAAVQPRMLHPELALADVEGANRHPARSHAVDQAGVGAVLRRFRQRRLSAGRQQELGSEETDAVRAPLPRAHGVVGRFDVGFQPDLHAVFGDRRQPAVSVERLLVRRAPLLPSEDVVQGGLVGVDEHIAGRAVHREQRPGLDDRAGVVQPRDGRHVDRARQDRRVIRPAPRVGDDGGEALPVELGDHRRRQLVGHEHERALEVVEQGLEELDRIAAAAQVHAQAPDDVADVAFALAQVRVFGPIEQRGDFAERAFQRRRGVELLGADDLRRAIDQHRVVEHQELRVEQVGVLGADGFRDAVPDLLELGARSLARFAEPLELPGDLRRRARGTGDRACRA